MHLFLDFNSSRDQFSSAISEPPTPSLDSNVLRGTEIPSHQIQQQRVLRTGMIDPPPIYEDRAQPIQQQSIPPGTSEVREEEAAVAAASRETLITAKLIAQYISRPPPPQPSSSYPYSHFRFPSKSTLHTSSIFIPITATFSDFLRTTLSPLLRLLQTEREAEAEAQILQTTAGTITTATTTTSTYNNNNNNEESQCEIYFQYPKFKFNLHLAGKWKLKWNKWMERNSSSTMKSIHVNEEN